MKVLTREAHAHGTPNCLKNWSDTALLFDGREMTFFDRFSSRCPDIRDYYVNIYIYIYIYIHVILLARPRHAILYHLDMSTVTVKLVYTGSIASSLY
jgi:hypothetical protein